MCFSVEASLSAWILANGISLYLFYRDKNYDRWNAAFITTFSTIQLIEAGIWMSINKGSKTMNNLLTKLAFIILLMQPLVQSYMGYRYTKNIILYLMTFVFLGILIGGFITVGKSKPEQFYSSVGSSGHLVWHNNSSDNFSGGGIIPYLYMGGLVIPLLFMKEYRGIPLLAVGLITAIYSISSSKAGEFGSLWCFTSVLYAVAAIFV